MPACYPIFLIRWEARARAGARAPAVLFLTVLAFRGAQPTRTQAASEVRAQRSAGRQLADSTSLHRYTDRGGRRWCTRVLEGVQGGVPGKRTGRCIMRLLTESLYTCSPLSRRLDAKRPDFVTFGCSTRADSQERPWPAASILNSSGISRAVGVPSPLAGRLPWSNSEPVRRSGVPGHPVLPVSGQATAQECCCLWSLS